MSYWKEVDYILDVCRISLLEIRFKLEDTECNKSDVEEFEKKYNEIITKCSKEAGLDEKYFKELLDNKSKKLSEEDFVREFIERFGEEYEDILQPYLNIN